MIRPMSPRFPWKTLALALGVMTSLGSLVVAPSSVNADANSPVVVVVESADRRVDASALRVAIAREGVPAYALSDDAAPTAEGTLTVVIPREGAVRMRFTDPAGHTRTRDLEVDHGGQAPILARLAVRLVRESRVDRPAGSRDVLDPWRHAPEAGERQVLAEVLDPWGDHPPRARLRPYTEVLDPWASTPADSSDAPAVTAVGPEVIDPWATEDGQHLDAPRR